MIGGYHNGDEEGEGRRRSHQIFLPFFEWHDTETATAPIRLQETSGVKMIHF